jgi:hypothetical protein
VNRNVVRSAFTVFVFWWVALAVYDFLFGSVSRYDTLRSTTALLMLTVLGVMIGIGSVWFYVWSDKKAQRALLQGESVRGLVCTLGELPILAKETRRAENLPDFSNLPNIPSDFFHSWIEKYQKNYPAHVQLMCALLRIYEQHKNLPATHIVGGHGGRTLLQHSLLAAYFMDKLAHSWSYTGLRDRAGKRVILKLRDQAYRFNPDDPLIAIIGIAHDIGKIEAYIYAENDGKKIIGIHHEHDLTGARMIARLPESWSIPDDDRQAMFLALAHYHHPMALPLSPDRRAIDDRTIALMELLIKTDFVTSRVETKGVEPTEKDYEEIGKVDSVKEVSVESVWQAFVEIISEHGRINSPDPRFNVGTLCTGKGFTKPMLLIKEDSIRSALIKRLHLQTSTLLGDGRYQITIDLLRQLDTKGVLYRIHEDIEFSAENALWNVDFMTRTAVGAQPEKKSGWSAVIIIDPKLFTRIEQAEPYWWFAVIQRGTMGAARAINKKGMLSTKKSKKDAPNLIDASEAEFSQQIEQAKKDFSTVFQMEQVGNDVQEQASGVQQEDLNQPLAIENKMIPIVDLDDLWEEKDAQQSEQTTSTQTSVCVEHDKAVAVITGSSEEPKKRIAPIDVKNGLIKAVLTAKEQDVILRELNDRYLVSNQTLNQLVPEIDWDGCRYKIEQMTKSSKLDAMYSAIGESGAFILVFSKTLGVN